MPVAQLYPQIERMVQTWAEDTTKKAIQMLRDAAGEGGAPPIDVGLIMLDEVRRTAAEMNMPPDFIKHVKLKRVNGRPIIYNDWTKPATKWEGERELWRDFEYGTSAHFIAPRGKDAGFSNALIWQSKDNREWNSPGRTAEGKALAKVYARSGRPKGSGGHTVRGIPGLHPMKTGIDRAKKRLDMYGR